MRCPRSFFRRDPVTVARHLLGQRLVHVVDGRRRAGTILETEAYLGHDDQAAHTYQSRRTARTQTMFEDGGTAYVYLNYGIHHMLNIVVDRVDQPQAVLIRAAEPTEGLDAMQADRPKAKSNRDLCSGPGKLGAAFAIQRHHDGTDLVESPTLFIEQTQPKALDPRQIVACPRIGVDYAGPWAAKPLRFVIRGHPGVSVKPPAP